jgi:hypothetical protein
MLICLRSAHVKLSENNRENLLRHVGRQSRCTAWDDEYLLSFLDPSGQKNKTVSQHIHDKICKSWPESRVPLDLNGKEMPLGSVMSSDWPMWRQRSLFDLAPAGFDRDSVRFDLQGDLSSLSPFQQDAVKKARGRLMQAFRQVSTCYPRFVCFSFLVGDLQPPSLSEEQARKQAPKFCCRRRHSHPHGCLRSSPCSHGGSRLLLPHE